MNQGIQTSFQNYPLRKYGCYFFCLLRYVELATGKTFDPAAIVQMFEKYSAVRYNWLSAQDCFVYNPIAILNAAADKTLATQVISRDTKPEASTYIICNSRPGYTHFTLSHNGEIWDPLDPARPTAKLYKDQTFREFVL